jgi:hypothetical protein
LAIFATTGIEFPEELVVVVEPVDGHVVAPAMEAAERESAIRAGGLVLRNGHSRSEQGEVEVIAAFDGQLFDSFSVDGRGERGLRRINR